MWYVGIIISFGAGQAGRQAGNTEGMNGTGEEEEQEEQELTAPVNDTAVPSNAVCLCSSRSSFLCLLLWQAESFEDAKMN